MTDLQLLREEVKNKLLDYRCIDRLVQDDSFDTIYKENKIALDHAIKIGDLKSIKRIIRDSRKIDIKVSDLRMKAQDLGIKNWSRLNKSELLSAIAQRSIQSNKTITIGSRS